jgi:hypothetical protein
MFIDEDRAHGSLSQWDINSVSDSGEWLNVDNELLKAVWFNIVRTPWDKYNLQGGPGRSDATVFVLA